MAENCSKVQKTEKSEITLFNTNVGDLETSTQQNQFKRWQVNLTHFWNYSLRYDLINAVLKPFF